MTQIMSLNPSLKLKSHQISKWNKGSKDCKGNKDNRDNKISNTLKNHQGEITWKQNLYVDAGKS
jgi:hypothetical protein